MTEVTQADREAAAKWAKMQGRQQQAANMRRGSCDTAPLVQAFARHREAAVKAALADDSEMLTIAWMDGSHRSTKAHRETIAGLRAELDAARAALEEIAKAAGEMPSSAFEQHAHRIARAALGAKP